MVEILILVYVLPIAVPVNPYKLGYHTRQIYSLIALEVRSQPRCQLGCIPLEAPFPYLFNSQRPPDSRPLPASLKHLAFILPSPTTESSSYASHYKDPCDWIGPIKIMQDNFPISRSSLKLHL